MMKKRFLFCGLLIALFSLTSCKSEYTNVSFGIDTNGSYGRLDSTGVESTKITLYYNSDFEVLCPDWVSVTPKSGKPAKPEVMDTVHLYFKGLPNQTGAKRIGRVQIVAPNGIDLPFDVWQNAQPAPQQ